MPRLPTSAEIDEMARTVMAEHGAEAQVHVTRTIGRLMAARDLLGVSVWREVRKAIKDLQQGEKPQG